MGSRPTGTLPWSRTFTAGTTSLVSGAKCFEDMGWGGESPPALTPPPHPTPCCPCVPTPCMCWCTCSWLSLSLQLGAMAVASPTSSRVRPVMAAVVGGVGRGVFVGCFCPHHSALLRPCTRHTHTPPRHTPHTTSACVALQLPLPYVRVYVCVRCCWWFPSRSCSCRALRSAIRFLLGEQHRQLRSDDRKGVLHVRVGGGGHQEGGRSE